MGSRSFHRLNGRSYEQLSYLSNVLIIDDYRNAKPPELRFTSQGPSIPLLHNMTLHQLE